MRKRPWIHDDQEQKDYDTGVTDGIRQSSPGIKAARRLANNFDTISHLFDGFSDRLSGAKTESPEAGVGAKLRSIGGRVEVLRKSRVDVARLQKLLKTNADDASTLLTYLQKVYADVDKIVSTFPGGAGAKSTPRSARQRSGLDPINPWDEIVGYFQQICSDMNQCACAYGQPETIQSSDDLASMMTSILSFGNTVAAIWDASNMDDSTYRDAMKNVRIQLANSVIAAKKLSGFVVKLDQAGSNI